MFDDDPFRPVSAEFALPSSGWTGLGSPAGSRGYRYSGAGSLADPCRVVLVKERVVKAVCKGAGVALPTPFLGRVGILLTVGTDSKRYCAYFDGDESRNDATLLKRRDAPAPSMCPLDLHSSTTAPPSSSTTSTTTTHTMTITTTSTSTSSSSSSSVFTTFTGTITTTSTSLP
jgi:hypothetical protein